MCKKIIIYASFVFMPLYSKAVSDPIRFLEKSIILNYMHQIESINTSNDQTQRSDMCKNLARYSFEYWYQGRYLGGIKSDKIDSMIRSAYVKFKDTKLTHLNQNITFQSYICSDPLNVMLGENHGVTRRLMHKYDTTHFVYLYKAEADNRSVFNEGSYKKSLIAFTAFLKKINNQNNKEAK